MTLPISLNLIKFGLEELCRNNKICREYCRTYLNVKWGGKEAEDLITLLSELLLNPDCTEAIAESFPGLLLQLLSRSFSENKLEDKSELHKLRCVALGKLVAIHSDAVRFSLEYFRRNPAPFHVKKDIKTVGGPSVKRQKISSKSISDYDLVLATYNFLSSKCEHWRQYWNWSIFLEYLKHQDEPVRWLACQCVATVSGMAYSQRQALTTKFVSNESANKLSLEFEQNNKKFKTKRFNFVQESTHIETNRNEFVDITSSFVVSVAGILLPVFDSSQVCNGNLVLVSSTITNLRSLALAVAAGKAVCLEGPVGCGKTSLVEYLALITGRCKSPNFIKVQLGDQTDSKMLLGTYRCTEVAGEFVWQPGVLTQAVIGGHWILLEDIDSAPTDVIAVLASLIETGSISVPGYRDTVNAAPGFQLFTTQRLIPGSVGGLHKQQIGSTNLMEKLWVKVSMEPLSGQELIHVIKTLFPVLSTITTRLLDVFLLFSAGKHHTALPSESCDKEKPKCTGENEKEHIPPSYSLGSRLTSTRDLIKWCSRVIIGYDVSSQESSLSVLSNAVDIFCCSVNDPVRRLELAASIAACLGVIRLKAEYVCQTCKPVVTSAQEYFCVGRAKMQRLMNNESPVSLKTGISKTSNFSLTRPTCQLLERVGVCITRGEAVLLVGETGTGKTSVVQFLANELNAKLVVLNMNQQSDTADLLGGYKPVDLKCIVMPVKENFESLFVRTFSRKQNIRFLEHISTCYQNRRWQILLKLMKHSTLAAVKRGNTEKKNKIVKKEEWVEILKQLEKLEMHLKNISLAFSFIEGSLVKALREGWWVLLDEINLASGETLECLSGLLEGVGDINGGSLCLHERGDTTPIVRHPNFRLFACMNPATDVGKKDLPPGLRNRFTEFFVDELIEKTDLIQLAGSYLSVFVMPPSVLESIVSFYLKVRKEATLTLCDGTGHKPHYSLRTLCRALTVAAKNPCGSYLRSLYEAFCLGFLTQLDRTSYPIVEGMISKSLFKNDKENKMSLIKRSIAEPTPHGSFVCIEGYWVRKGSLEPAAPESYILTPSVRQNLRDLARIVSLSGGNQPALIQGETSVGKTSLVEYLAAATGNVTLRVNNHEHTDLQEYVGAYTADPETGIMIFNEGVLVEAMRKGYWIILDELNLAPSDVLEALNRVLDDNRELYIAETQEMVQAHPHFMLFATQNPPGHYGGRKLLSRAFRNRFVELHFDEIPPEELKIILEKRCHMPPSYCKKLVAVMTDLQIYRRGSAMFAGKQGFITLRDLFRWGERYRLAKTPPGQNTFYDWDLHLAHEGYLLLAGRVRKEEERIVIAEAIKKHLKRTIHPEELFTLDGNTSPVTRPILEELVLTVPPEGFQHLVWTQNMRRQAVLLAKAFQFAEPVLLVGETGIGKTTVCQLIAALRGQKLMSVNCHMHTEGADFLGGLRPVREHAEESSSNATKKLFEWVDGPLIKAMRKGDVFLADEISLADDSVLERLNSLLEPERKLLLAEKGGGSNGVNAAIVIAHKKFHFVGTMNPGGDFGKKELSPALRNRFTEIWCEGCRDRGDLVCLIEENLRGGLALANQEDATSGIGHIILDFVDWFTSTDIGKRFTISIRDYLNWINFINVTTENSNTDEYNEHNNLFTSYSKLDLPNAIVHGACFTFLDSLGSGVSSSEKDSSLRTLHELAVTHLIELVQNCSGAQLNAYDFIAKSSTNFQIHPTRFGTEPFFINVGNELMYHDISIMQRFSFNAPTSGNNARRLLRALQISGRPILLEGSPGVGKTALVAALANGANHRLVRINLSEQTDVSDLFGADLPVEGGEGGQFSWRDGPFLQALKSGSWIVLDELNLASQSVLEGLNAALDHRGEVFVPELGRSFAIHKDTTRIFACQNPFNQGGARRGLPRSFLNRFTQVYIDALTSEDLEFILTSAFPAAPQDLITRAVTFNASLVREIQEQRLWGHRGAPWEFNLRDLLRWFESMNSHYDFSKKYGSGPKWEPAKFVGLLYVDRMRTMADKEKVKRLYTEIFSGSVYMEPIWDPPRIRVGRDIIWFGDISLMRCYAEPLTSPLAHNPHPVPNQLLLHRASPALRSLSVCVQMKWLPILVGGVGSGKTSLVQLLAHLTGNELRIMPVNSSMDTTEILGGFEQTDYSRHFDLIAEKTESLVMHSLRKHLLSPGVTSLSSSNSGTEENFSMARNLLRRWEEFQRLGSNFHVFIDKDCEMELFQQKMNSLKEALKALGQACIHNISIEARSILKQLEDLWKRIKKDGINQSGNVKAEYKLKFDSLASNAEFFMTYEMKNIRSDVQNKKESIKKLRRLWEEFKHNGPESTKDNEIHSSPSMNELFLQRLTSLKEVLQILKFDNIMEVTSDAESMMWQVENLELIVKSDGGKLNGGGRFEWVDSMLVKCLKEGCWLLVENVNLCSPSVLDRLNALLEPNGTLTIGERGVGPHNEAPTIIPHPDFRLFFTLDPRHGQISRAMRNRGVEIFLLGPEEGIEYDCMDTRALLSEAGIESVDLQAKLLAIHNILSSRITGPDKPSLPELLRVAFLLSQQLSHLPTTNNSLRESLHNSFCDVYVRGCKRSMDGKRAALALLDDGVKAVFKSDTFNSDIVDSIELSTKKYSMMSCKEVSDWHITLRCSDLEMDTYGAFSRQRAVILEVALNCFVSGKSPVSPPGFSVNYSSDKVEPGVRLPQTEFWASGLPQGTLSIDCLPAWEFISRLVLAYYSTSSVDESFFRHRYLITLAKSVQNPMKMIISEMSEKVSLTLSSFPSRPDKPWDQRWWNTWDAVDQKINACILLLDLRLKRVLEKGKNGGIYWWSKSTQKQKTHLSLNEIHEYMKDGSLPGVLELQNSIQPIANQFTNLCLLVDEVLEMLLVKYSGNINKWDVLWQALQWRSRLIALGFLPICKRDKIFIPPQVEDVLWIHIKWILKYFARPLTSLVCDKTSDSSYMLGKLTENLQQLESSQSKASEAVIHLAKEVGEKFGWPNAYCQTEEVTLSKEIDRLEKALCYDSFNTDLYQSNLCVLLTPEGKMCHQELVTAYLKLYKGEVSEATIRVKNVFKTCTSIGVQFSPSDQWKQHTHQSEEDSGSSSFAPADASEAQIWPFNEIIILRMTALLKVLVLKTFSEIHSTEEKSISVIIERNNEDGMITIVDDSECVISMDVNHLLEISSSLYYAALHSRSTSSRFVASVKRIHDFLKEVLSVKSLIVKDWLITVQEFLVSSAKHDENSVARYDLKQWAKLQGVPEKNENEMFSSYEVKEKNTDCIQLHCPVLSLVVTSLTMSEDLDKNDVLRSAPLNLHSKRRSQLKLLSDTLWKNLGSLASQDFIYRLNDAKSALSSSSALLEILSLYSTVSNSKEKWESMLFSFTQLLEEKNGKLITTLDKWMNDEKDELMLISLTGMCWSLFGGLCALLTTASGLVDPAQKRAIKIQYLTKELEDVQLDLYVQDKHSRIELGLNLDSLSKSALHPCLFWFKNRELLLKNKLDSLSKRIAARPTPSAYYELSKALNNFVMRIGSPETLEKIHKKLSEAMHNLMKTTTDSDKIKNISNADKALKEAYNWKKSLLQFTQQFSNQFGSWYQEMVTPVVGSVYQMIYGISLHASAVEKVLLIVKHNLLSSYNGSHPTSLDQSISKLVCFPSVGPLQPTLCSLAQVCVSKNTVNLLERAFEACDIVTDEKERNMKKLALSLMMVGLEEVKNEMAVRKEINQNQQSWDALLKVLWNLAKAWRKDQERIRQRKAEEENLFTTRCANRPGEDDDTIDPAAVSSAFPTYKEDFEDLEPVDLLDDHSSNLTEVKRKEDSLEKIDYITEENMVRIAEMHSNIVTSLTFSSWLLPNSTAMSELRESVDYLEPLMTRYKVFFHVLNSFGKILASDIDVALYPSLTLLTAIALQESSGTNGNLDRKLPYPKNKKGQRSIFSTTKSKENPDFYHDPWQEETMLCFPILIGLKAEIQKLLISWPEHPVLNQILEVVERILGFPPTSPLSRFVTGLELTLAKAQEWEANAHSGISLCNHLALLTNQILQWRRIELNCWKDCLNRSVEKAKARASKWWFYLFWLVHSYVKPEEETSISEEEKEFKASEPEELLALLKQFMEGSSLGEFEIRLDLIYTFHCHTVHLEASERQRDLQRMLWNVHSFYSQFRVQVEKHLQKLRKPIEKQLKDYVKIARWNDISYWSVKETVTKIHRTLHKHTREFEKILQQPVSSALTQTKEKEKAEEDLGEDNVADFTKLQKEHSVSLSLAEPTFYLSQPKLQDINQAPQISSNPLISQSGVYFTRARRLCKEIMSSFKYPSLINSVEVLTAEVINTAAHLSSLQVPVGLTKEKQRSAAKNIVQRKRRALADLFRALSRLGLSYRTGLMIAEKQSSRQCLSASLDMFLMPPLDLNAAFYSLKSRKADSHLLKVWDGCESYFVRSMSRLVHLDTLLAISPSKDLGPPSIERCRGFTAHLMHMAKQQKEHLASTSNYLVMFRKQLAYLSALGKSNNDLVIPSQDLIRDIINRLLDIFCSSLICLEQTWLYLHACPASSTADCESDLRIVKLPYYSDCDNNSLEDSAIGDEKWQSTANDIRFLVGSISQLKSEIERLNFSSDLPFTPSHWTCIIRAGNSLEKFSERIGSICSVVFRTVSKSSQLPSASESLIWLSNEMLFISRKIESENIRISESLERTNVSPGKQDTYLKSRLANGAESLLKKVLLIFQAFFKKYNATEVDKVTGASKGNEKVGEVSVVDKEMDKPSVSENEESEERDLEEIEELHLSEKINNSIVKDLEMLQLEDITSLLRELITDLCQLTDCNELDKEIPEYKRLLLACLPSLDQLSLLSQFLITQQTMSYRSTCKLLSSLLAIFSDLAARGFCIPKGLEDDGEEGKDQGPGRGDGKWEESEGMGLGDAEEGDEKAKEASDKLESEDQLEGAHQEGKEREDKADKDLKEEETGVEMSEDFEGKLQELGEKENEEGEGEDDSDDDDDDVEKQMGKTGSEAEKLDDQIWGSDSEDENGEEDEGEEKGSEGEEDKDGGKGENPELGAKDKSLSKADEENRGEGEEDKKKKQDINEMEDKGEIDDDQVMLTEVIKVDPYHGNQEPLPEPEPLDLPEDLQLDDGEAKDKDGNEEENPFDIDTMKEQMGDNKDTVPEDVDENADKEGEDKEAEKDEGEEDDQDAGEGLKQEHSEEVGAEEENDEKAEEGVDKGGKTMEEDKEEEGKDEEKEENKMEEDAAEPSDDRPSTVPVQAAEENLKEGSKDKTECVPEDVNMEEGKNEEEDKEKHGVGLAQEERKDQGHGGEAEDANVRRQEVNKEEKEERKKRKKPGESDSRRTLGETKEPLKKKLKTVETQSNIKEMTEEEDEDDGVEKEENQKEEKAKDEQNELYEHIKEAKQSSDVQTLDAATKDQAQKQPVPNLEEEETDNKVDEDDEVAMDEDEPLILEDEIPSVQKSEEVEDNPDEKKKKPKKNDDRLGDVTEEGKADIEGEVVVTAIVPRGSESTFHTQHSALDHEDAASHIDADALRQKLEQQLAEWSQPPAGDEALITWESFVSLTEGLSRDLSEQLRLVLEPTQASRLKGDYRTGRRINMRKVIPYIASQFRKDKIWLRRTKPSKREYQIVLAIDDSSSMADNHSKELAFESLALVSRALTLLEAGQLAVVSFGESVKILHPLNEPFSEHSGARLLQQFSFDQKKTLMGHLMDTTTTMLCNSKTSGTPGVGVAQLIVIVSDGRGVWNEGSDKVKSAVRRAQDCGIFTVFVIVDNPESKDSIMDIRMPIFKDGKMLGISSYLDNFPFPFYLILRDINALPGVLSDALRQWFELVTEMDKQ